MSTISPEPKGHTTRVSVRGGDLHVVSFADPHTQSSPAPVVLALHGWALDHRLFAPQASALASRYRLLALDRRGFGTSQAPPDMRLEVEDIERVVQTLAIEKLHLLGVSQGGRIALRYAARFPQRILSLALLGTAVDQIGAEESPAERLPVEAFAELARAGRMDLVRARWLAHPMMRHRPSDPQLNALLERMVHEYAGRDLTDFCPEAYAWDDDVPQKIGLLKAPALLVTGEHETLARKQQARALLGHLKQGEEKLIPAAGHLANLIAPKRFNDYLVEHLASTDAPQARR